MPSFAETFRRNQGVLSKDQQLLLQAKTVAVIGCGGLGGYVIEELVRIGVGRLHLFDPDVFTLSNCNRQLYALQSTLGSNKAEAAARRVQEIHPYCVVRTYSADFRDLAGEAEPFQVDAAIDCLDKIQARHDLADLCDRQAIPLVHGAVSGWYGQVGVHLPGSHLIGRLYPHHLETNSAPSVLACTVAVVASIQAAETVKLLLGLPSALHNTWLHIDLKENEFLVNS